MSTTTVSTTRQTEGLTVPEAGTWALDPAHSSVGFVARHMMVTKVRGSFGTFEGAIHVAEDPKESWAEARIETASITTRNEQRDGHLRSGDFLLASEHPEITFKSTSLEHVSGEQWKVRGDLSIRGVTKEVELDVIFGGTAEGMSGPIAFFSAETEIDREDWGITWNQALETGGVLISKKIKIEIEAQAVLQDPAGS